MHDDSTTSVIRIGSAPCSWGVWFPSDPYQVSATTFLDEVAAAGYEWVELGPHGFLPTEAGALNTQLDQRALRVSAGTVFEHLHRENAWDQVWQQVSGVAALTHAVGGTNLVVIPEPWRDHKTGEPLESPELDARQWDRLATGMNELGRRVWNDFGLAVQFHSHADSHVGYQADIERFLSLTDPDYVNLCLDTGHVSYYGGDNVDLITRYPGRIGYLHLKQVDPRRVITVHDDDLSFPEAVQLGVMTEPPQGVPEFPPILEAVGGLGRDVFAIVEQDLYPCAADVPLPIAQRTHRYLSSCRSAPLDIGSPGGAQHGGSSQQSGGA